MLDALCIPQDPSTEGVCEAAGSCVVVLVLALALVDAVDEDSKGGGKSDDKTKLQLPNCGWHPAPQYTREVPQ